MNFRKAGMRLAVVAALVGFVSAAAFASYATKNYQEAGGARWVIGDGGEIDILSGGAIKVAGVDVTTGLGAGVGTPVSGVAAGYKVARGETALDGSNPTAAATGLTTIVACTAALKGSAAPGVGTSAVTYTTSSGTLSVYGWKVTSSSDTTLIASTGTETVGWICVGT